MPPPRRPQGGPVLSPDFLILLLAAAASAYGAWAVMKGPGGFLTKGPAVLIFLLVGMQTVLFAALTGDGRIVPWFQLNPSLNRYWRDILSQEGAVSPDAAYCLGALLAHLLAVVPRPTAGHFLRPLPATLVYVGLFFALQDRAEGPEYRHERSAGPGQVAYLTIAPLRKGVRLVLSAGPDEASFLRVRHVHDADSAPPAPKVLWTKDGKGLVVAVLRRRLLAVDLDTGAVIGALPGRSHEWPTDVAGAESVDTRRRFTQAERDVAEFVVNHGGLHVD